MKNHIYILHLWLPICNKAGYWTMNRMKDCLIVNIVHFKPMIPFVTQSSAKLCYRSTDSNKRRIIYLLKEKILPEFNWYIYHKIFDSAAPPLSTIVSKIEVVSPDLSRDLGGHVIMKHEAR